MTQRLDLYKCKICGNLTEVILSGAGEPVCCGQPMELLVAKTEEGDLGEKHVPVFEPKDGNTLEIRTGSTLHPMTDEHYIQFIETISEGNTHTELRYLSPSDLPIMQIKDNTEVERARIYCNIHGLWEGKYQR